MPLALLLGGWRGALLAFAAVTVLALVLWWVLSGPDPVRPGQPPRARRFTAIAWREPAAWLLAIIFWLEALPFYGLVAWLPSDYVERGWSAFAAGLLVSLVGLFGMPASLIVGWLSERFPSRREPLIGSAAILIVALLGLIADGPLAWFWAALAGAMLGAQFTLSLLLPLDVSHDTSRVAAVTGVALGVGYLLTAMTPAGLGLVRDLTGSFDSTLWLMILAAAGLGVASWFATPDRLARAGAAAREAAASAA